MGMWVLERVGNDSCGLKKKKVGYSIKEKCCFSTRLVDSSSNSYYQREGERRIKSQDV